MFEALEAQFMARAEFSRLDLGRVQSLVVAEVRVSFVRLRHQLLPGGLSQVSQCTGVSGGSQGIRIS